MQIEIPGIVTSDFIARYSNDSLYLPYVALCRYLSINGMASEDNSRVQGEFPAGRRFEIATHSGRALVGPDTLLLPPTAIRIAEHEVYIEQSVLFRMLGIAATFDLDHLRLRIAADERIPRVQHYHSKLRYAGLQAAGEEARSLSPASLQRHLLGGPAIDWRVAAAHTNNGGTGGTNGTAGIHAGAEFLYGELEVNASGYLRGTGLHETRARLDSWNWRFFLPEFAPLRRIALGTILINQQQLLGVELSNTPLTPRIDITMYEVSGRTQPNWTVELYDGQRLEGVAVADSMGMYSLPTPVGYGTVDRTVRFVGPNGEAITEQRRVQLPPWMVPAAAVEYDVRMGALQRHPDSMVGAAAYIAVGLSRRLTLGASGSGLLPGLRRISSDSIAYSLFANMWLGESASLALRYRGDRQYFSGDYTYTSAGNTTVRLGVDSVSLKQRSGVSTIAAMVPFGNISVGGAARLTRATNKTGIEATPEISGYVAGVSFQAATRFAWAYPDSAETLGDVRQPAERSVRSTLRMIVTPVRGLLLGAAAAYEHTTHVITGLDFSMYIRLLDFAGLNLNCSVPGLAFTQASFGLQLDVSIAPARIFLTAGLDHDEITTAMLAQGSMRLANGEVLASRDYSVGKSSISVRAFYDRNHNGRYDAGDEMLAPPRTTLYRGATRLIADDGMFTALNPNTPMMIEVDRWEFAAEGLFPRQTRRALLASPSANSAVDIPYVEGFEIAGLCSVESPAGCHGADCETSAAAYGLRFDLIAVDGDGEYEGEVFSDGSMLISGMGAGRYRLRFDPAQLAARHLEQISTADEMLIDASHTRLAPSRLTRTMQ